MRHDYDQFTRRDAQVIVVGPDNARAFARYWTENDLPFVGLPNPDHSILKLYGQKVNLFKLGRMPAQVLIDKRGVVRYVHYGDSMSDIPENPEMLVMLDRLNEDAASADS